MKRIDLAQHRGRWWALADVVMNLWVPYNLGNLLTSNEPITFSTSTLFHIVNWSVGQLVSYLFNQSVSQ